MKKGFHYDLLLTYASEKGAGSWDEFKDAWTWLLGAKEDPGAKAWVLARDLAALGHIEIAWLEQRWCVAPPLLTMIPRSGGRVLVTGARTRAFRERLEDAAESRNLWIDECGGQPGPKTLYVACSSHLDAEGLAADLGVAYTYQVAEQIAALLPPLETYTPRFEERDFPRGLESEFFETDRLEWVATSDLSTPGLYRCKTYEGHVHGLLDVTSRWLRVVREFGIYEVLRWDERHLLEYSIPNEALSIPAATPLPALHARAATLCSGRLPSWSPGKGSGVLTYCNVPLQVAEHIAASLRQEVLTRIV